MRCEFEGASVCRRSSTESQAKMAENDNIKNIRTIKCGLRSIIRQDLPREWKQHIARVFSYKSIQHTWLWQLASLQFLYRVNSNFDQENWIYFEKDNGAARNEIINCFRSVLRNYIDSNDYDMPPQFREMCYRHNCHFPDQTMNNEFTYAYVTYETNIKTNLKVHMENRVKTFLQMRVEQLRHDGHPMIFSGKDINNTVKYAMNGIFTSNNNQELVNVDFLYHELIQIGAPNNTTIKDVTENHWFWSLPMWICMERHIEAENMWRSQTDEHDSLKHLSNFTVVPLCGFTRKFVEMDSRQVYDILAESDSLPRDYSKSKKGKKISTTEFNENKAHYWSFLFDVDEIRKLARNKHEFRFHMLSDGVSVCLQYDKPRRDEQLSQDAVIKELFEQDLVDNEIGIDVNMRTYMAVVRRNVRNDAEVSTVRTRIAKFSEQENTFSD